MRQEHALAARAVPKQEPAAGHPVGRRSADDDRPAVGMCQEAGRADDGRRAPGEHAGVAVLAALHGVDPRCGRVPLEQVAPGIRAHEELVALTPHGVPLPEGRVPHPRVAPRIVAEEPHREGTAAADGAARRSGHAHHVRPFALVVETDRLLSLRLGVFDHEDPLQQVKVPDAAAVGKRRVKEALAPGHQPPLGELRARVDARGLALVEHEPVVGCRAIGLAVDLAVRARENRGRAVPALALRHERDGLARPRIEGDDLARGAAHAEVNPAGVVGGDGPRILRPVLLVEVPVVVELAGLRIKAHQPALRIGGGPDHAVLILGHAHGHLRGGLATDSEGPPDRVEFHEVAAEVAVELPATILGMVPGKDRGERAIAQGEGDRVLLGLAGLDVDRQ